MLKKLYKHEFYSLFRTLLPIYGALLGFAVINRLMLLFETENAALNVVQGFTTAFYVFSIVAMFVVGFVIVILRFYRNLLTHEGYLTFSLPVTATQHITCKLVCGILVTYVNFVAVCLSLLILGAGSDILKEVFETLKYSFDAAVNYFGEGRVALFIVQIIAMIIITTVQGVLMFYVSMAIGQQFKNKILGSAIAYICIYAAVEMITALFMLPIMVGYAAEFEKFMNSGIEAVQLFLIFPMALSLILAVVYFFVTRYFLTKKLNLE